MYVRVHFYGLDFIDSRSGFYRQPAGAPFSNLLYSKLALVPRLKFTLAIVRMLWMPMR